MSDAIHRAPVVDCDTHFWQPVHLWDHLIEKRHRAAIVSFLDGNTVAQKNNGMSALHVDASGKPYSDTGDDPTERLTHMDREGIDVQIIFPGASRAPLLPDPEAAAAACRAVNQWNAEFAAVAPSRFKPTMVLPMRYPGKALEVLGHAADTLGLKSAFVGPTPPAERRWSDPALDPVWQAMEASRIVVCMHEFTKSEPGYQPVARPSYSDSYSMMYYCGHTVEIQLALMDLVVGGVMERFPKLQFGFIEAHTAWLPAWLAHMDSLGSWLASYKRGRKGERHMSLFPTEFFRRQCFIASFPDDAWIAETIKYVGEDNVVLCTDYPHPGTSRQMVDSFKSSYPDIPEVTRGKLLGGNAERIFSLCNVN
jgi:predicted TIM-barrel fold metal-dependent hydrolase